jgi:dihydrofolate reductase
MILNFELVVAHDIRNVIGKDGKMPWQVPEDLARFRRLTTDHIVVMGRKTYDSLPKNNRPLPNRLNIVITRSTHLAVPEGVVCTDMENAVNTIVNIQNKTGKRVFIIGGGEIYSHLGRYCHIMHITKMLVDSTDTSHDSSYTTFDCNLDQYVITNQTPVCKSIKTGIPFQYITYQHIDI